METREGPQRLTINCCDGCKYHSRRGATCMYSGDENAKWIGGYMLPPIDMTLTPVWCPVLARQTRELEEEVEHATG